MKNQKIWLDISTSMRWTGGVVGIVRAQLEIASAINALFPEVRFSMFRDGNFVELEKHELPWLEGEGSVAERYIAARKMNEAVIVEKQQPVRNRLDTLIDDLSMQNPSRVGRIQHAILLLVSALPYRLQALGLIATWLPRKILGAASFMRQKLYQLGLGRNPVITQADPQVAGPIIHPYKPGDIVVSLGWMDDGKEPYYTQIKEQSPSISLAYMVYDTILIGKTTRHLYPTTGGKSFEEYFKWISTTCDLILYAGNSPKRDGEDAQIELGWRTPQSVAISYGGTDLVRNSNASNDSVRLRELGIVGPFIMTVGTIEIRKNHDTLYKAYVTILESKATNLPQLIFCGKPGWRTTDLIDTINRDPRVSGKILLISPTDEELDALYRNCLFTLLPTIYEGWALPLTEGLSHGKFCLASDIGSLREIGKDFPDYISPFDVMGWARKIEFYSNNATALKERELRIAKQWRSTTWEECGKNVLEGLQAFIACHSSTPQVLENKLWMDLTLSYALWRGGVTGIIRTELILAHHLKRIIPGIKFFAFHEGVFFEIPNQRLDWLFKSSDVNTEYAGFQKHWAEIEAQGHSHRIPIFYQGKGQFSSPVEPKIIPALSWIGSSTTDAKKRIKIAAAYTISALPKALKNIAIRMASQVGGITKEVLPESALMTHPGQRDLTSEYSEKLNSGAQELPFGPKDVVFSAGTNWDDRPLVEIIKAKNTSPFHYAHIIYDFTPLNTPHLHSTITVEWYEKLFYLAGIASDKLIYGGETAMRDGRKWQKDHHWPVTPGVALKFGSDIAPQTDHSEDQDILQKMGVTGPFLLAVGTLEIRKNHETLYKAYLKLLEDGMPDMPQMVFVGGPGWKAGDLFDIISQDKRVRGKILLIRATDQQLDVLYRHCHFTLLASLYEGWSLTLPESLGYGKFCLTSDVPPLRETGRDIVDYIHPWDVVGWADKIKFYMTNETELRKREEKIKKEWNAITWEECAKQLVNYFNEISEKAAEKAHD